MGTSGGNKGVSSASAIPTVAEARASFAATVAARQSATTTVSNDAATTAPNKLMGNADKPTRHLLVHNMYDKDKETDQGWENRKCDGNARGAGRENLRKLR